MSTTSAPKPGDSGMGAGLTVSKNANDIAHPAGPAQHGAMGQAERAFSAASTFLSGVLAISASQFLGAPLKLVDPKFYDGYMAWTKESFAVLCSTMTQFWAPTVVRVTGDESMKGQLYQMEDGTLKCNFPHRLVLMANHQLYTDWMYLWWVAYTNKMHGRIYIILKESLKNIPIFGWGAQFYNFIFLARKWETDKPRFRRHLQHLKNATDPMWLLIFPEGTNLSKVTREKSAAWAKKQGISDMKHQLLPRSTGLQFCLQELKPTTNWLYDCTIAYEGVPPGMFGQDIFTLRSSFFEGRPPKSVNMHWRRWRISEIPVDNDAAFSMWLRNRWTEKDYLLEYFSRHNAFPSGDPIKAMQAEQAANKAEKSSSKGSDDGKSTTKPAPARPKNLPFITTEVKAGGWEEFLSIFGPITTAATALTSGDLDPNNIDFDALLSKVAQQQQLNLLSSGAAPKAPKNVEEMRKALTTASKPAGQPLTRNALEQKQRELAQAAARKNIPSTGDPNDAYKQTRQALMKASQPASGKQNTPNAKQTVKMTPTETMVTRPLSSFAVNKAAQQVKNVAAARKGSAQKTATGAQKTAAGKPAVGKPAVNGGPAKAAAGKSQANGAPIKTGTGKSQANGGPVKAGSAKAPAKAPSKAAGKST